MSLLEGAVRKLFGAAGGGGGTSRVELMCRQLGWSIADRKRGLLVLNFNDSVVGVRPVFTANCDGDLVWVSTHSHSVIPARRVPPEVPSYLLRRNAEIKFGAWQASVNDRGTTLFALSYFVHADGLLAERFKFLCETIAVEANSFDQLMHKAGLL